MTLNVYDSLLVACWVGYRVDIPLGPAPLGYSSELPRLYRSVSERE